MSGEHQKKPISISGLQHADDDDDEDIIIDLKITRLKDFGQFLFRIVALAATETTVYDDEYLYQPRPHCDPTATAVHPRLLAIVNPFHEHIAAARPSA